MKKIYQMPIFKNIFFQSFFCLFRTQNTVFCGRILLFLAKFFPFSERSGLNVISEFNLDNVTSFSKVKGIYSANHLHPNKRGKYILAISPSPGIFLELKKKKCRSFTQKNLLEISGKGG